MSAGTEGGNRSFSPLSWPGSKPQHLQRALRGSDAAWARLALGRVDKSPSRLVGARLFRALGRSGPFAIVGQEPSPFSLSPSHARGTFAVIVAGGAVQAGGVRSCTGEHDEGVPVREQDVCRP